MSGKGGSPQRGLPSKAWGRLVSGKPQIGLKGLGAAGEWRGREASERTSIKGLESPGE